MQLCGKLHRRFDIVRNQHYLFLLFDNDEYCWDIWSVNKDQCWLFKGIVVFVVIHFIDPEAYICPVYTLDMELGYLWFQNHKNVNHGFFLCGHHSFYAIILTCYKPLWMFCNRITQRLVCKLLALANVSMGPWWFPVWRILALLVACDPESLVKYLALVS